MLPQGRIPMGSLKKLGLAVWQAIGNIYTNVLFYYIDIEYTK